MQRLTFNTGNKKNVLDITSQVQNLVEQQELQSGLVHLFVLHTTACLTTACLDPGTDQDYLDALDELIPKLQYRHPHNPEHVDDHINSSLIGPSLLVPFENKQLVLGTWQQIVLIELDGPRDREVVVSFLSEGITN